MNDGDELSDEQHVATAREMYERWCAGEPKSRLEIEYWDRAGSHGKAFTAYTKKWLGLETEKKSVQTGRVEHLERLLRAHGIPPTDAGDLPEADRLIAKARESALAAIRVYNDPLSGFRTETFILLMVIAWNAAFQAKLEQDSADYLERDGEGRVVEIDGRPKVLDTRGLMSLAIPDERYVAVRANLDFFLGLRKLVAHRYLPALDVAITAEAQAMLLNFEVFITENFGPEARLGDRVSVPLQIAGFRDRAWHDSLKQAQAQLPTDVVEFLNGHRLELPEEIVRSSEYALQVFFVPVAANRERAADAVVHFLRPEEVPEALAEELQQIAVVTKPRRVAVASGDLLRPSEVVNLVAERLPFRFTMDAHTRAWRYFGVRPSSKSAEPAATDQRYCQYDRLMRGYGYTRAWVEHLVDELSNPQTYEAVVGIAPRDR
jgi:hypothetical protein